MSTKDNPPRPSRELVALVKAQQALREAGFNVRDLPLPRPKK